jgi:hypothetical protein
MWQKEWNRTYQQNFRHFLKTLFSPVVFIIIIIIIAAHIGWGRVKGVATPEAEIKKQAIWQA